MAQESFQRQSYSLDRFDKRAVKNVEEVFNLCSTEQSCINIGITCYKIGTLKY